MTYVKYLAVSLACASMCRAALAQGVATDIELAPVSVTGGATRNGLHASSPGTIASKTAEQLREQNLVNPEDALQYAPNTTIRKRYIGDRNALIAGRSFGTLQPSRALVYLDGYLISNFLGRFDAPRWNMISPEAIERIDMLYGPYSALLPGNSIGTTVAVTQRVPTGFELSGRLIGHRQRFDQYGHDDHHDGGQFSLHAGNRHASGLWFTADLNHQDVTSQPMQYLTPVPVEPVANAVPVTGIVYDTDPKGARRAVLGASGGAIDHTLQHTMNLRSGYRFTPEVEASMMASWWHNDSEMRNETFLRQASTGARVSQGTVTDGTNTFNIPASAFAPGEREEFHQQLGATLKTRHAAGWNGSLVVSDYRVLKDLARQAAGTDATTGGTLATRDGTGWRTAELQATWSPQPDDWTGGRHALAFGLHRNGYRLDSTVALAADWRGGAANAPDQRYRGRTDTTALYAQDAWRFAPDWKLTAGWREEWFRAHDGEQLFAGNPVPEGYDSRKLRGHSPKAALAFNAAEDVLLTLSVGRGIRFPNVEELYNGTATGQTLTFADPALKAETSDAVELSAEHAWARQTLRMSLYHDRVRQAILRQTTTDPAVCRVSAGTATTATNFTCVQNVDEVKTTGIEFEWSAQDLLARGVGINASGAYTFRSEVTANRNDPTMVGKRWLRVPRTRLAVQLAWRPVDEWLLAAGYRHQGRAYNETSNLDVNPDVYGGVSRVDQLDLRGAWKATRQVELALGMNNVTDQRAYQSHPYPGRTLFAELRFTN